MKKVIANKVALYVLPFRYIGRVVNFGGGRWEEVMLDSRGMAHIIYRKDRCYETQ